MMGGTEAAAIDQETEGSLGGSGGTVHSKEHCKIQSWGQNTIRKYSQAQWMDANWQSHRSSSLDIQSQEKLVSF